MRPLYRIVAAAIGLLFLVAGAIKALNPAAFAVDIQNYRIPLLPWRWDVVLALYLPWIEIICGAALALRIGYRGALAITAGLLATFIAAYGSTRPRGLDIACGCFGHGLHRGYWAVLIGDAILLAIVLWLLKVDLRPISPVIKAAQPANPPG
jgi:putative oxidoreductase